MTKDGYCGVNDLIPGKAYYGAGVWRNEWIYLGRNTEKEFVWYFIGNGDELLKNPTLDKILKDVTIFGYDICSTTKSIKKVKPLNDLFLDKNSNNYISEDTKKIVKSNLIITDIDKITREQLDYISVKSRCPWR